MLVRHFMTRNPISVTPETSCQEAYLLLQKQKIRRVPVVREGRLVGLITARDLIKGLPRHGADEDAKVEGIESVVANVMTRSLHTLDIKDHLEDAARIMMVNKIAGLPVLQQQKLVGIITESDVFRAVWSILTSGSGKRIILDEGDSEGSQIDYVDLLKESDCRIFSLLRCDRGGENTMTYLRIQGPDEDKVVEKLWDEATRVIAVD